MSERLLEAARVLADMPTSDMDDLNRSVHMRDLKTVIKRLLEHIERTSGRIADLEAELREYHLEPKPAE